MPLFGFGNHHQSEALPNTLPKTQNSPLLVAQGLFAEQLSGSAFASPRAVNLHSWLYRKCPSVMHSDYVPANFELIHPLSAIQPPNPLRWSALPKLNHKQDLLQSLVHMATTRQAHLFIYQCNQSMQRYFASYDGELLFIPYLGEIQLNTEFGKLTIEPGQIAIIPRGVFFSAAVNASASGFVCENQGQPFMLPELGLLGANALANPRHFLYPDAAFEDKVDPVTLICKYQDHCFEAQSNHSPLNVVAWHGNLAPFSYSLKLFNTLNSVSFDHPDPSIYTLLTSPSEMQGMAHLDFVLFPSRWMVAEHTFRPPYFHRNVMSELMGLIWGKYEAKQTGFEPGGLSIHNAYTSHGPDSQTYYQALTQGQHPVYLDDTLAFMLESHFPWQVTDIAMKHVSRQTDYTQCWQGFASKP
jgi:homogentisate 1,2-dioxygenase